MLCVELFDDCIFIRNRFEVRGRGKFVLYLVSVLHPLAYQVYSRSILQPGPGNGERTRLYMKSIWKWWALMRVCCFFLKLFLYTTLYWNVFLIFLITLYFVEHKVVYSSDCTKDKVCWLNVLQNKDVSAQTDTHTIAGAVTAIHISNIWILQGHNFRLNL